ncbi:MAG: hypothetical protein FWG59_01025, partial [Betaproteobacteria bacterium]|nr:hypothetical protein [Betaproteobacteria bacterium]
DGSLGGEYGSRNTFNFYPGGCALLSHLSSNAAALLGYFEYSLEQGTVNYLEDDGVFGHGLSSMVTALCANSVIITPPSVPEFCTPWIRHYVDAGLYRAGVGTLRMYGNLNKGGCYKVFRGNKLLVSDTGYMGRLKNGDVFCQNTPNNAREVVATNDRRVASSGLTHKYNNTYLSIVFSIALRLYVLFFGKIPVFSRILRRIMQTMLIYKKKTLPVRWSREVILDDTGITVRDAVRCENRSIFVELFRTTDAVNLHVVTSNSFQQSNLFMWERCADTPTDKYEVRHRYEVQP